VAPVDVDRPPPGQDLNPGEVTPARPAASAILVRDGDEGLEVLLVQRNPEQKFMGGAWVFPGGAVQEDDADPAAAALRELDEEAGIRLAGTDALIPYSRWITPAEVKIRFDTHFFMARSPAGARCTPDGAECVDGRWLRPRDALNAHARDELMLVFPTIKHLEQLAELRSVDHALETAQRRKVLPVQPRVLAEGGVARVVLPGEPGYGDP
jgi:8-oxo-dGTP pyrophosphatase MutT (NUDIX family)